MRQPTTKGVCTGDRGSNGLFDLVRKRRGEFPHHVDSVDVCEISLQLTQPFALRLGALSVRYVHRDADVFADFLRGVVMSDATQRSDGAIGVPNPKFNVVIRPGADRILKLCAEHSYVFRKNCTVIAVEWNRALAGIEAVQASVFVR